MICPPNVLIEHDRETATRVESGRAYTLAELRAHATGAGETPGGVLFRFGTIEGRVEFVFLLPAGTDAAPRTLRAQVERQHLDLDGVVVNTDDRVMAARVVEQ